SSGHAQTFWDVVPGLDKATAIVGSVPYEIADDTRAIYLFVTSQEKGKQKLQFIRYDLIRRAWDAQPTDLDLPSDTETFTIRAVQAHDVQHPPELALYGPSGFYVRPLAPDGADWAKAETPSAEDSGPSTDWQAYQRKLAQPIRQLHAVLKTSAF